MSLLSSREIRLSVGPDQAHASAWSGRWRPEKTEETTAPGGKGEGSDAGDGHAIRPALDLLASKTPIGGCPLHVDLADSLLHFDVAQGDFAGLATRTLASFADACVAELLGESAADYAVRWQLQRDERHLLVRAVPRRWLDEIGAAAAAHGLAVRSIRPQFDRQWNRHLARHVVNNAVFVVAEDTRAVMACVRDGVVTALSSGPWLADRSDFTDSTVDRLLAGLGLLDKERVSLIDLQVDRLLAGLGVDPKGLTEFVLVQAGDPPGTLSARWTVQAPHGGVS